MSSENLRNNPRRQNLQITIERFLNIILTNNFFLNRLSPLLDNFYPQHLKKIFLLTLNSANSRFSISILDKLYVLQQENRSMIFLDLIRFFYRRRVIELPQVLREYLLFLLDNNQECAFLLEFPEILISLGNTKERVLAILKLSIREKGNYPRMLNRVITELREDIFREIEYITEGLRDCIERGTPAYNVFCNLLYGYVHNHIINNPFPLNYHPNRLRKTQIILAEISVFLQRILRNFTEQQQKMVVSHILFSFITAKITEVPIMVRALNRQGLNRIIKEELSRLLLNILTEETDEVRINPPRLEKMLFNLTNYIALDNMHSIPQNISICLALFHRNSKIRNEAHSLIISKNSLVKIRYVERIYDFNKFGSLNFNQQKEILSYTLRESQLRPYASEFIKTSQLNNRHALLRHMLINHRKWLISLNKIQQAFLINSFIEEDAEIEDLQMIVNNNPQVILFLFKNQFFLE